MTSTQPTHYHYQFMSQQLSSLPCYHTPTSKVTITAWRQTIWLQTCGVCLTCPPDDVCSHHLHISSMSASRSVQLLETEPSLSPVLDYKSVCHQILLQVTLCHGSAENSKHSYSHSLPIPLFCFSFFSSWS